MVFTNVAGSTKKTLEKSEKNTQYAWAKYMSKVNDLKVDILKRVEYKNDKQLKHTILQCIYCLFQRPVKFQNTIQKTQETTQWNR